MNKKYAFFDVNNGVYLGLSFFEKKPSPADFGFKNAIIVEVSADFQNPISKYNFTTKEIETITIEECDLLTKEALLTAVEKKMLEVEKKYNEAQYLIVKNTQTDGCTYKIPLQNDKGYALFKGQVNTANLYGEAWLKWEDMNSGIEKPILVQKNIWLEVGKKAENISFLNFDKKGNYTSKINDPALTDEEILNIEITFPNVQTMEIDFSKPV